MIDEVMVAKPRAGFRVLMTHGGAVVRAAVEAHLMSEGINRVEPDAAGGSEIADAVSDVMLAGCLTQAQVAAVLDYREAVTQGRPATPPAPELMRTHRVVLVGPPNAGKSSLLNALSGYDRAFVDAEAGATRDVVDELVELGGYAMLIGDLPGFDPSGPVLGAQAWQIAKARIRTAEQLWFVCDGSVPWREGAEAAAREVGCLIDEGGHTPLILIVINKSDRPRADAGEPWLAMFPGAEAVSVCSLPDGNAPEVMAEWLDHALSGGRSALQ